MKQARTSPLLIGRCQAFPIYLIFAICAQVWANSAFADDPYSSMAAQMAKEKEDAKKRQCQESMFKVEEPCDRAYQLQMEAQESSRDAIKIADETAEKIGSAKDKFKASPSKGACDIKQAADQICGTEEGSKKCKNSIPLKTANAALDKGTSAHKAGTSILKTCTLAISKCTQDCTGTEYSCPKSEADAQQMENLNANIANDLKLASEKIQTLTREAHELPRIANVVLSSNGGTDINRCRNLAERNEDAKKQLVEDLVPELVRSGLTEEEARKRARELAHEAVEAQAAKPDTKGMTAEELKKLAAQDKATIENAKAVADKALADREAARAIRTEADTGDCKVSTWGGWSSRPCTAEERIKKAEDERIAAITDPTKRQEEAAARAREEFLKKAEEGTKHCWLYERAYKTEAECASAALDKHVKAETARIEQIAARDEARRAGPITDTRHVDCPNAIVAAHTSDRCPPLGTGIIATVTGDNWVRRNIPVVGDLLADGTAGALKIVAKVEQKVTEGVTTAVTSATDLVKSTVGIEVPPKDPVPYAPGVHAAAAPITEAEARTIARADLAPAPPAPTHVGDAPDGPDQIPDPAAPRVVVGDRDPAPAPPVVTREPTARTPPARTGGPTGGEGPPGKAEPTGTKKAETGGGPPAGGPTAADQAKKPPTPPNEQFKAPPEEPPRPEAPPVVATKRAKGGDPVPEDSYGTGGGGDSAPNGAITNALASLASLFTTSTKHSSAIDAAAGNAGSFAKSEADGGKGKRDKDRSRVAKKEELEAEVNNGFASGPKGGALAGKKDKNGKTVPAGKGPKTGGVQMAALGAGTESSGGPNWRAILMAGRGLSHPNQKARRIAGTGQHREVAAYTTSLFGNINRAYSDEGPSFYIGFPINNFFSATHLAAVVGGELAQPLMMRTGPIKNEPSQIAQPRSGPSVPVAVQSNKSNLRLKPLAAGNNLKQLAKISGVAAGSPANNSRLPASTSHENGHSATHGKGFRPLNLKKAKSK